VIADANGEQLSIAVRDNGIGIPAESIPTLFDKFTRIRDEKAEGIEGTGLGLFIVKKLVEAHQGEISVESTYGEGSVFTLTLPLAEAEEC
jgi:two-component system phosphate regulon sensor histidine kinase PhoR